VSTTGRIGVQRSIKFEFSGSRGNEFVEPSVAADGTALIVWPGRLPQGSIGDLYFARTPKLG